MSVLFVSATGTGVGKTHVTGLLVEEFARLGLQPGVCKPVETGVKEEPGDAAELLTRCRRYNPRFASLDPREITAYTFTLPAAPFCADERRTLDPERIKNRIEELERRCDLLLVEGAGGLMVPLTREYMMIDLARELQAPLLLVTPSDLGCINATLLSLEALRSRKIPHEWCVNLHRNPDGFDRATRPFYDAAFPGWWSVQEGLADYARRTLATMSN